MVIKTDPCAFSELKIYPGRGTHFASKDGKVHFFISSKTRSLYHQKIKPVKLTWTQAWRRFNKKVKIDEVQKKRTRKTTRVTKAVVGMTLEEIKRKKAEDTTARDQNIAKQAQEIKDRNKKKMDEKKKKTTAAKGQAKKDNVSKAEGKGRKVTKNFKK